MCPLDSPTIRTRSKLNYEYEPSRTTELCVDAMDGFCAAETYCVMVEVININESPDLGMSRERKVYEGFVSGCLFNENSKQNLTNVQFAGHKFYTVHFNFPTAFIQNV